MAFVLYTVVPLTPFPPLVLVLRELAEALATEVRLDEDAQRGMERSQRAASWCPWPSPTIGLFVDGASARGIEVGLRAVPGGIEVRLCLHSLGTWTDWRLLMELAVLLADRADGYVTLQGGGRVATSALRGRYLDDAEHYERDLLAGLDAVRRVVEEGRVVRLGGPRGTACVGPLLFARVVSPDEEPEEQAEALLQAVLDSLDARGFESYYAANLMCLDGRTGQDLLVSLLPSEVDTLLRDPEFVLLSPDLEGGPHVPLMLLPFDRFEEAFPGLARWLDDRTCAVPAVPAADWPALIARIRPLLIPLADALDGPDRADAEAWRRFVPTPDDGAAGRRD